MVGTVVVIGPTLIVADFVDGKVSPRVRVSPDIPVSQMLQMAEIERLETALSVAIDHLPLKLPAAGVLRHDGQYHQTVDLRYIQVIQPHHSVSHFIDQLDSQDTSVSRKRKMPDWLQALVWNTTEHFDPIGGMARAGYIASYENEQWVVRLFLGETEVVGGHRDGAVIPTAFTLDLESVRREFQDISRMEWHGMPAGSVPQQQRDDATIAIDGVVGGQNVRMLINLRSPADMGPGLKQHTDGSCLPA